VSESRTNLQHSVIQPSSAERVTQDTVGVTAGVTSGVAPVLLAPGPARIDRAVAAARDWLLARQDPAGFWCGELEGDTTLESYAILLEAFLGSPRSPKVTALAQVAREEALPDGGWAQYPGGPPDVSVSTLTYFALRIAGDRPDEPHMRRACAVIASLGGVERANTYTKYHLALFGQYAWQRVPAIPPEMVFLPRFSPFTVHDMSSWSRTIFVPLSILYAAKPVRPLPDGCGVEELFPAPPAPAPPPTPSPGAPSAVTPVAAPLPPSAQPTPAAPGGRSAWQTLFFGVDRALKTLERLPGADRLRSAAVKRAAAWMIDRLAHSDGLSAILPAMANSVMALDCLGYRADHPLMREQRAHLDGLLIADEVDGERRLRMQPCLSPVWDTVLASHALGEAAVPRDHPALRRAVGWLLAKQTRLPGDWSHRNAAPPGGWYFEHRNEFYPDVDDTCMALMVLRRNRLDPPDPAAEAAMARGLAWMLGMQNDDGGWGSFDRNNHKEWLTHVPFADHNAMIDPSTADITARVLECLSGFPEFKPAPGNQRPAQHPVILRALGFLRRDQCTDGSWYGRWGVNYLYGTWQVLRGLRAIGEDLQAPYVRRAARWLLDHQNADGGWGESIASYDDPAQKGRGGSTPSQTAWALMGLLASWPAGDGAADPIRHAETEAATRRGVRHLLDRQSAEGTWQQASWTGTGFPKVFYLNYHHYRHYFPLMALGQYRAARFPAARSQTASLTSDGSAQADGAAAKPST
jgi:squalene-hopene/tetraprenyl-beta-curcumene cyclase